MVGVIFYILDASDSVWSDIQAWRLTVFQFKQEIDFYIGINKSSENLDGWFDNDFETHIVSNIDEALAIHPENNYVVFDFENNSGRPLHSYQHKDNVTYVFGADMGGHEGGIEKFRGKQYDQLIIPTGNGYIYTVHCLTLAMYDRINKGNRWPLQLQKMPQS